LHSNIGERLRRVRHYLEGEDEFLVNYADDLSDLPPDKHIAEFRERRAVASMIAVRTAQRFHCVDADDRGYVTSFGKMSESEFWINAGFFCLRTEIFDYIEEGDELVEKPFERLIAARKLAVYRYPGFWQQMDTLRDKILFDRMEGQEDCKWMVWKGGERTAGGAAWASIGCCAPIARGRCASFASGSLRRHRDRLRGDAPGTAAPEGRGHDRLGRPERDGGASRRGCERDASVRPTEILRIARVCRLPRRPRDRGGFGQRVTHRMGT